MCAGKNNSRVLFEIDVASLTRCTKICVQVIASIHLEDTGEYIEPSQVQLQKVAFHRGSISFRPSRIFEMQSKSAEAQMIQMMGMPPQSEAGALHERQQDAK